MTISQDPTAPLIVVVGATGAQGGSVIQNLAESNKPYRMRGLTRDTSKPGSQALAKQGVEMVAVEPVLQNKEDVLKAFEGATYIFAVTMFRFEKGQEREEGKMLIDAAKAANIKLLIWSGLPSVSKVSGGRYRNVYFFDEKAEATEYTKAANVPFVNVQPPGYMKSYLDRPRSRPVKQADGSFVLSFPSAPDKPFPLLDTERDYGLFVRKAIEEPIAPGTEIYAHAEFITFNDLVRILSKVTGKKIAYVQATESEYIDELKKSGLPDAFVRSTYETNMNNTEFGYWGDVNLAPSLQGLARKPVTWEAFCEASDWSEVLG